MILIDLIRNIPIQGETIEYNGYGIYLYSADELSDMQIVNIYVLGVDNLKILFLSDLQGIKYNDWEQFLKIDQSNFELIIVLGDIDQSLLYYISTTFISKTILGVLGNHDCHGDLEYSGITNIHNSKFIYKNISFVGLEGSIKYKDYGPMLTQYE